MFKVHIPSTILYVTPEQLPRFLANLAETHYVAESGEYLQTLTFHEPSVGETTHTLLLNSPVETLKKESSQYQNLWKQARNRAEKAEAKIEALKQKCKKKG
jgi:hypothetical protein